MLLALKTLSSNGVYFIWPLFGIQRTGQWGSGSVINYRQISSYKDPSPVQHCFSWRAANLINQQKAFYPASSCFMTWSTHFLYVSSVLHSSAEAEMDVWSQKTKIPTHSSKVVNPTRFLLSHSFTVIFIFCLSLLLCMHNTHLQSLRKELL